MRCHLSQDSIRTGEYATPISKYIEFPVFFRTVSLRMAGLYLLLGASVLCIAVLLAWMISHAFLSRLEIRPLRSPVSDDPFEEQFVATNNSPVALSDVHFTCSYPHIGTTRTVWIMVPSDRDHVKVLNANDDVAVNCDFPAQLSRRVDSEDIDVVAWFRIKSLPFQFADHQKFAARRAADGTMKWRAGSNYPSILDLDFHDANQTAMICPWQSNSSPEVAPGKTAADINTVIYRLCRGPPDGGCHYLIYSTH